MTGLSKKSKKVVKKKKKKKKKAVEADGVSPEDDDNFEMPAFMNRFDQDRKFGHGADANAHNADAALEHNIFFEGGE